MVSRRWYGWALPLWRTLQYWMEMEVHVFAFSIAANVLLSFFPFLLVLVWFGRTLGWDAAEQSVYLAMGDLFGPQVEQQIRHGIDWVPQRFKHFNYTSILLLLFTANGVFEPLEIALNKCWGIHKHRSFLMNQLVSIGLIFACGTLALLSVVLSALNADIVRYTGTSLVSRAAVFFPVLFLRLAAMPVLMLALFLVYWILPNGKVDWKRVLPVAVVVGLLLEALKYLLKWMWPAFIVKIQIEYGPFYWAVIVVLVSFLASMLVLAGAEWASRSARTSPTHTPQALP
jgi:uncharacterized BrkB/YihY/UPF0761 family membrane protein